MTCVYITYNRKVCRFESLQNQRNPTGHPMMFQDSNASGKLHDYRVYALPPYALWLPYHRESVADLNVKHWWIIT